MTTEIDVVPSRESKTVVPFASVPLPSKGLIYPDGHPLHKKDSVDIKAMTSTEEDILTSPPLLKKGTVTSALLRSCMVNKMIDPQGLLVGDKSAILLAVRISGFGSEYKVKTSCVECGKGFTHVFDLSKLELKTLSGTPTSEGQNLFKFVLPRSKKTVLFSLLTDEDETEISRIQDARKKSLTRQNITQDVEHNVTDRLIRQIKQIDSEKDPGKLASAVREMLAFDSRSLRGYIRSIEPEVIMEQEVTCPMCGVVDSYDIPLGTEFLWPRF